MDQIEKMEEAAEKDRLEYVRSIRFVLGALHRSLLGWMQWVSNPDIMSKFTTEDLAQMHKKLCEFTRSFVEYDLEATKKGEERGLVAQKRVGRRRRGEAGVFYI